MRRRSCQESFAVSSDFKGLRGGKFPCRVYPRADEEHECDRRTMLLSVMAGLVQARPGHPRGSAPRAFDARDGPSRRGADFNSASSEIKALGAFLCNGATARARHSRGSPTGVARRQPRARVPHLVGSTLPSPYHFRARIQSFQAVAAPFPGDSVLPSGPLAARSRRGKRLGSTRSRGLRRGEGRGAAAPREFGPARSRDNGRVRSST
jgi:hypothetical protein